MLLLLLLIPLVGIFIISTFSRPTSQYVGNTITSDENNNAYNSNKINSKIKTTGLITSLINLLLSVVIFLMFNLSSNQFQFVQEQYKVNSFDFYIGVDGISIYFVMLTTIIIPVALLSNWKSISENIKSYVIIVLLLETLLLAVFLVLDILLFYIFFESILPPLFILIGLFGSSNRVRASFYLFLYTLIGSLFLLLSILTMSSIMGTTDFDALYKTNFNYTTQLFLFYGIFIAFAVKTPTIFLNTWLLKAHVESPLGGSIILAGVVLKLSLYGILRLILPLLPKAYIYLSNVVYVIGVITIVYASFSTLRTIDIKELIAYSSVSHAAVYLLGVFSNTIQGIEGGIVLGLAHGFVSSGLFICAGGILYDRSSTRLITFYRGMTQVMPVFSILFFILCLGNAGTPLSLNFIGEFMSLYGTFEKHNIMGALASTSIIFSAAYTMYMFNRISFGGSYSKLFLFNIPDLNKREFTILLALVLLTVFFGIYPAPILDGLHYSVSSLIFSLDNDILQSSVWIAVVQHITIKKLKIYTLWLLIESERLIQFISHNQLYYIMIAIRLIYLLFLFLILTVIAHSIWTRITAKYSLKTQIMPTAISVILMGVYKIIFTCLGLGFVCPFISVIGVFGRRFISNHLSDNYDGRPTDTRGLWPLFLISSFMIFLHSYIILFYPEMIAIRLILLNIFGLGVVTLLDILYILPLDLPSNPSRYPAMMPSRPSVGFGTNPVVGSSTNPVAESSTNTRVYSYTYSHYTDYDRTRRVSTIQAPWFAPTLPPIPRISGGYTGQMPLPLAEAYAGSIVLCVEVLETQINETGIIYKTYLHGATLDLIIRQQGVPSDELRLRLNSQREDLKLAVKTVKHVIGLRHYSVEMRAQRWVGGNGNHYPGPTQLVNNALIRLDLAKGVVLNAERSLSDARHYQSNNWSWDGIRII